MTRVGKTSRRVVVRKLTDIVAEAQRSLRLLEGIPDTMVSTGLSWPLQQMRDGSREMAKVVAKEVERTNVVDAVSVTNDTLPRIGGAA